MTDPELLSAAIKASGLSVRRFAAEVLTRDPRTVWRWLRGPSVDGKGKPSTNALPEAVRAKCEALIASVDPAPDFPGKHESTG